MCLSGGGDDHSQLAAVLKHHLYDFHSCDLYLRTGEGGVRLRISLIIPA